MSNKHYRCIMVTNSRVGVLIGFHWQEGERGQIQEQHHKYLEYPNGAVLESVSKALGVFSLRVNDLPMGSVRKTDLVTCDFNNPDTFDQVIEAEEPEQFFISRYVTEGA
jgi:hypothetical protein